MIKAVATIAGKPALVIGLSGENITRLMAGEPITFLTAPLGLPALRVVVMGGRTEEDIAAELRHHAGRMRLDLLVSGDTARIVADDAKFIAHGRALAADDVEQALRQESDRLASLGTVDGVEQGIGVAKAVDVARRAALGTGADR